MKNTRATAADESIPFDVFAQISRVGKLCDTNLIPTAVFILPRMILEEKIEAVEAEIKRCDLYIGGNPPEGDAEQFKNLSQSNWIVEKNQLREKERQLREKERLLLENKNILRQGEWMSYSLIR